MGDKIWLKRVLIPLWVIQLIIALIFVGASAFALWVVEHDDDFNVDVDAKVNEAAVTVVNVGAAISLSLSAFTIILDIVEIILAARHKLRPVGNIVMQCIKSAIWTFYFIITIIAIANSTASGLSIFLVLVLFLTCMAQLIYGSVILHRHRKGTLYRGNYALAEGGQTAYTGYNAPPLGGPYNAPYDSGVAGQPNPFRDPSPAPPQTTGYKPYQAPQEIGTTGPAYPGQGVYEMQSHPNRA